MEEQNILDRIRASYYQLTTTERRVADFVLEQQDQVQFMSITQLADECGTAEATISRFCRSLKLKGFNAFKLELARLSATNGKKHRTDHGRDTLMGRSQEVGRSATDAVAQTIQYVDPAAVEKAVTLIERAPRVICVGSGGSMIMAAEFCHLFSTVTSKFLAIDNSHLQMSAIATAGAGEVVVLFSYSGATTDGLRLLEQARARNVHTILVTRFPKSPAASLADVVLRCGSNEGPFQFGSIPAKVAQLIVMDVIFQEYCHRNREECEKNVQSIASALSAMHI